MCDLESYQILNPSSLYSAWRVHIAAAGAFFCHYYSVEGLHDFWLLIDAEKIENRKTLFFPQQCAHLIAHLIN
jgi:hypothetical protein